MNYFSKSTPRFVAVLWLLMSLLGDGRARADQFDVRSYGAKGDGKSLSTAGVQAAIDACHDAGGGTVVIGGGHFVIGTIWMKSFVTLRIEAGASLLGSTDITDYATDTHKNMYKNEPHMDRCLIFARGATQIGFEGHGEINGRGGIGRIGHPGHQTNFPNENDPQRNRPMLMRLLECSDIRMRDLKLRNPAAWTSAWLYCDDIVVDGITISSRTNHNGDGLDFDGCTNVRVNNCAFDTSDDSICLQASRVDRPCENVTIQNCVFVSKWAGIRIGLLSRGDFSAVTVSNCIFRDIEDSGLKIQMCEGGVMENMTFSNLVMQNVPRPVFMTFCQQRACVDSPVDQLAPMNAMRGFVFDGMVVDSSMCGKDSAIVITGMPGHSIESVRLHDIQLHTGGGGDQETADQTTLNELTPEVLEGWWPEYTRLGHTVPAHGIYARHVDGLEISNVTISPAAKDLRPGVFAQDVKRLGIDNITFSNASKVDATIRLQQVNVGRIRNCTSHTDANALVDISGGSRIQVSDSNSVIGSSKVHDRSVSSADSAKEER